MKETALLVGNDINNINPGVSWNDLIISLKERYRVPGLVNGKKPFPLLYEEIFLSAIKQRYIDEKELKIFIADHVFQIGQNEIHERIRALPIQNIITTNYEFSLEGTSPQKNTGLVRETLYSIFRQYLHGQKSYWHIHGDCKNPSSINLGFEHYCGQLQKMRDYVVNGPDYASKKIYKRALIQRLLQNEDLVLQSWIDLFFTHDVHIFGLSLDFVETDLWWLMTYRARNKLYKRSAFIKNELYYYIPTRYVEDSLDKIELLKATGVHVIIIDEQDKAIYYHKVIDQITRRIKGQ